MRTSAQRDSPEERPPPEPEAPRRNGSDRELEPAKGAPTRGRPLLVVGVVVLVLGCLFVLGLLPRLKRQEALRAESSRIATEAPSVVAAHPRRAPSTMQTTLPGNVSALRETILYGRTSGYVQRWLVDIGDSVKEGQLLADIATPELDQEMAQAQANLGQAQAALVQAQANAELAKATAGRYDSLAPAGITSHQEVDEKRAGHAVAIANVTAAEAAIKSAAANLARLSQLKAFARITAPFPGTITARTTEVGSLVTAGGGQGQELFRLAQVDPVRVFVQVPQPLAPSVVVGQEAKVEVRGLESSAFVGKVARTAKAVDPVTRTMLTEIDVPNPDHALMPGMYAYVSFAAAGLTGALLVPSTALIVAGGSTQIAVLNAEDKVHLVPVHVDVDLGTEVVIAAGLTPEDRVIANPGDQIAEGAHVTAREAAAPDAKAKSK